MTTIEEYTEALRTVKRYREERGMDFYLPVNVFPPDTVTLEEFRIYLTLNTKDDSRLFLEPGSCRR